MVEENQLKEIIGTYLKRPVAEIGQDTLIDRTVLEGSILIHRMYAAINGLGFRIQNYHDLRTYGDLLKRINGQNNQMPTDNNPVIETQSLQKSENELFKDVAGVGIDLEHSDNMPDTKDFRTDPFYIENFTQSELSYAILQANPKLTLTGLFAVKEAVVKAAGHLKGKPFKLIEIHHDLNGKPLLKGFKISISHSGNLAIAIALA